MIEKKDTRKEIYVSRRSIIIGLLIILLTLAASLTAWSISKNPSGAESSVSSEEGKASKSMPVKVRVINPLNP